MDGVQEMALKSFGYGRWNAPYWFIGPEQGQARSENDDLSQRVNAWRHFGKRELDDCRDFHAHIGEERWHPPRPQLQATWRPLILLLMTFLERPSDNESLRAYQRDQWGRLTGETCVIELSGLAAHSFKIPRDRHCFREERIAAIRQRMLVYKPTLVVMYGKADSDAWNAIAGCGFAESFRLGSTILARTPHPTTRGLGNAYWLDFGRRLSSLSSNGENDGHTRLPPRSSSRR